MLAGTRIVLLDHEANPVDVQEISEQGKCRFEEVPGYYKTARRSQPILYTFAVLPPAAGAAAGVESAVIGQLITRATILTPNDIIMYFPSPETLFRYVVDSVENGDRITEIGRAHV